MAVVAVSSLSFFKKKKRLVSKEYGVRQRPNRHNRHRPMLASLCRAGRCGRSSWQVRPTATLTMLRGSFLVGPAIRVTPTAWRR
jgi:hypothetical protein